MTGSPPEDKSRDPIESVIRRTLWGMALERFLRAFWPLGALVAALWAALAFGLAELPSRPVLMGGVGVAVFAVVCALWYGVSRLRWPSRDAARARVDATLPGRPLAALADRPALGKGDPGAEGLWAAHLRRMAAIAAGARAAPPDLRLARHDPWALRLAALVALIAALVFARADPVAELGAALASADGAAAVGGPSYEAWAEPPAYTGRPTLYLPEVPGDPPAPLPEGTAITLRVYGEPERFALTQGVAEAADLAPVAPGIGVVRFVVARSGAVALAEDGGEIAAWNFEMEPDAAPTIAMAGELERGPVGETELRFRAEDDHGVTAARAEIALDLAAVDRRHGLAVDPVARAPIAIELPLPGGPGLAGAEGLLVEDFSKHPWAGLPVTLRLTATDALGQTGAGAGRAIALPGKRFYNPLAAALVEQRRDLLWSPENAPRAAQVLRAVSHRPEAIFTDERAYLMTRVAIRRIEAAPPGDAAALEDPAEMLWRAALLLEEGSLGDAAERLARAKERLKEALRNDASDAEIAQLMQELREATQDYMRQLAQEAIERGEQQQAEGGSPPGQSMTQDQIQALMDRIQELSEQGRRAEAEQLLEMLQQMLENMEMRLAQDGQGQGQGGQGQGEQSMQGLGDALREQQNLADDSFQQLQREFREGRGQEGGAPQSRPGEGQEGQGAGDLAERQQALRELTEGLQRSMPGEAGEAAREALRQAERDMSAAEGALREGDTSGALDRQSQAIDSLREGMREMAEAMRGEESDPQAGSAGEGPALSDGRQDPLGRPLGSQGAVGAENDMVPEGDTAARARGLLDEIRRRSGEQARPQIELDYLRRLLDRF